MFLAKTLFVLAIVFFIVSCATTTKMYSGPELPANEVAFIQSASSTVTIESCDGKKISVSRVAVLPGEHLIEMSFYDRTQGDWISWSISNSFLSFTAEAGRTYSVDWETDSRDDRKYVVVLRDRKTGQDVPYMRGKPRQPLAINNPGRFFQVRNPNNPQEVIQWGLPNETACLNFLSLLEGSKEFTGDAGCNAVSQSSSLPCVIKVREKELNTTMNVEFVNLESCRQWGSNGKLSIIEPCKCGRGAKPEGYNQDSVKNENADSAGLESGRFFWLTNPFDLQVIAQLDLQSERILFHGCLRTKRKGTRRNL